MFARPDTGGTPTSYPAPTYSACRGIFDAIALLRDGKAWIEPVSVEICRPVGAKGGGARYQRYTTNYGGPLRKPVLVRSGDGMQFAATVLADVCYRLHGQVLGERMVGHVNPRHHLQEMFNRRVARGQCYRVPALGWREFACTYWGPPREERYEVDTDFSEVVPSMLIRMWDRAVGGRYAPQFAQNVRIERGVLRYAE